MSNDIEFSYKDEINTNTPLSYYSDWLNSRRKQLSKNILDTNYQGTIEGTINQQVDRAKKLRAFYDLDNKIGNASGELKDNQILVNKNLWGYDKNLAKWKNSTLLHELTHGATNYGNSPQEQRIKQFNPKLVSGLGNNKATEYLLRPSEIYARIMQFRQEHNLNPNKEYSTEEIRDLMNKSEKSRDVQLYDPNDFTWMINNIAQVTPQEPTLLYAKQGIKFKKILYWR